MALSDTAQNRKKELFAMLKHNDVDALEQVLTSNNLEDINYLYKNKKYTEVNILYMFIDHSHCLENIFYRAVKESNLYLIEDVLKKGFDVNYRNGWAIIEATYRNNLPMMKLLVKYGGDINACDGVPLRAATTQSMKDMSEYLLSQGAANFNPVVKMSTVSQLLKDDFKPYRGGIIPYFFYNHKPIFMMGVDRRYGELTDFGGTICYKKDKNFIQGSLRELKEESLNILDYTQAEIFRYSPVLHSSNTAITFLLIGEYFEFRKDFREIMNNRSELCDVFFVSMQDLMKLRCGMIINRGTYYGEKKYYRSYKLYDLVKSLLNSDAFYQLEKFIAEIGN
jgi:hypothetical protein